MRGTSTESWTFLHPSVRNLLADQLSGTRRGVLLALKSVTGRRVVTACGRYACRTTFTLASGLSVAGSLRVGLKKKSVGCCGHKPRAKASLLKLQKWHVTMPMQTSDGPQLSATSIKQTCARKRWRNAWAACKMAQPKCRAAKTVLYTATLTQQHCKMAAWRPTYE